MTYQRDIAGRVYCNVLHLGPLLTDTEIGNPFDGDFSYVDQADSLGHLLLEIAGSTVHVYNDGRVVLPLERRDEIASDAFVIIRTTRTINSAAKVV